MATEPARTRDDIIHALTQVSAWYLVAPAGSGPHDEPDEIKAARHLVMDAIGALKEGDTDPWLGKTIKTIVRKSTHYIVYIDDCQELQWWWIRRPADMLLVGRIQAEVSRLEHESAYLKGRGRSWRAMPWTARARQQLDGEPDHALRSVRMLIGESMAIALNGGNEADCQRALAKAEETILLSKEQHCRPIFFAAFAAAVAVLGVIHWVMTACGGGTCWTGGAFSQVWREAAFAGAAGAFVSAMLRTRDLKLEPFAGHAGIAVDAVARALIGAAAGVLVVMGYDSGLILKAAIEVSSDKGKTVGADSLHALRIFLALAAGSSARLLPSLVGRAEALVAGTAATTAAPAPAPANTPKPAPPPPPPPPPPSPAPAPPPGPR